MPPTPYISGCFQIFPLFLAFRSLIMMWGGFTFLAFILMVCQELHESATWLLSSTIFSVVIALLDSLLLYSDNMLDILIIFLIYISLFLIFILLCFSMKTFDLYFTSPVNYCSLSNPFIKFVILIISFCISATSIWLFLRFQYPGEIFHFFIYFLHLSFCFLEHISHDTWMSLFDNFSI